MSHVNGVLIGAALASGFVLGAAFIGLLDDRRTIRKT